MLKITMKTLAKHTIGLAGTVVSVTLCLCISFVFHHVYIARQCIMLLIMKSAVPSLLYVAIVSNSRFYLFKHLQYFVLEDLDYSCTTKAILIQLNLVTAKLCPTRKCLCYMVYLIFVIRIRSLDANNCS